MKKLVLFFFIMFSFYSQSVSAAFILNGTRYIYNEGRKNISIEIDNQSKKTYGGQVWIDNINLPKSDTRFVAIPSFFKVNGGSKQIIRIMKVDGNLPENQESIFWLNVQEIPPIDKNQDENSIVLAVNTKVKLIYRPSSLINSRLNAEKKIKVVTQNDKTILYNPTPFYFAITNIEVNNKDIQLRSKLENEISMLKPFSQIVLPKLSINKYTKIAIDAIDDYGATNKYEIQ
ncbi:fimbrial chaperone [Photobacterium damselae]